MEFKVGDMVKVKDIEDLIKRGRCDEKTARHISGVKFIINAFVVKSNQYELKDKTGSTVYCYEGEIEKCENIENESIKNDRKDDKIMMDLLPWPELEEIAKVYTAGAKKYGPNRWQNLPDGYQRYKGAMLRHLTEVEKGNEIDQETGCLHIAQVAWNAIAMLHCKMKEMKPHSEKIPENANDIDK